MKRTISKGLLVHCIVLLAILVTTPACNLLQDSQSDDVVITLDQPFELFIGETGRLGNELQLTFETLNGDSRCPLDVQCIWEGEVDAAFKLITTSESITVPYKGFVGLSDDTILLHVVERYGIQLQRLDPYPRVDAQLDVDKSATLIVTELDIR